MRRAEPNDPKHQYDEIYPLAHVRGLPELCCNNRHTHTQTYKYTHGRNTEQENNTIDWVSVAQGVVGGWRYNTRKQGTRGKEGTLADRGGGGGGGGRGGRIVLTGVADASGICLMIGV